MLLSCVKSADAAMSPIPQTASSAAADGVKEAQPDSESVKQTDDSVDLSK